MAKEPRQIGLKEFYCREDSHHLKSNNLTAWQMVQFDRDDKEFLSKRYFVNEPLKSEAKSEAEIIQKCIQGIVDKLCAEHTNIVVDPDMVGGMPHIKGVRLSVGTVLAKLYIYGSIEKIKEIYQPDVTEEQIKEAIAFAQDFLEKAYARS